MSKLDTPVHKNHASGSWRAVRSMAVPANVLSVQSNQATSTHPSGARKIHKIEEEKVFPKSRKTPGYFDNPVSYETLDPFFSKS